MKSNQLIKQQLFWEKYRPKSLDEAVLLPRIRKVVEHGLKTNLLFYGQAGIGKTTVARILVQNHPYLTLNSKLGVDKLRNEVHQFCNLSSFSFDQPHNTNIKVVYLEEFDGATRTMQDELRAFIEEFESRVRFIATCNDLSKIIEPVQSRFYTINFNPQNSEEVKFLRNTFAQYLIKLNQTQEFGLSNEILKQIILKNFPDFRKTMQSLQIATLTGGEKIEAPNQQDNDLYSLIEKNPGAEKTWNYLYQNWQDRLDFAFQQFGRHWWGWVEKHHPENLSKMPNRIIVVSEYIDTRLPNSRDPLITLYAMISKLQTL